MNITQLETYLNNHEKVIRTVFPWSDPDEGMKEYRDINQFFFKIYWTDDGITVNDPALVAVVDDWDGSSEKVYIKGRLPYFLRSGQVDTPFRDRVQTAVNNAITNETDDIQYAKIVSSDEDSKVAFVNAYIYNISDNVVEEVKYIVWEKADTSLGFKRLIRTSIIE
jgi:hypothetical protein